MATRLPPLERRMSSPSLFSDVMSSRKSLTLSTEEEPLKQPRINSNGTTSITPPKTPELRQGRSSSLVANSSPMTVRNSPLLGKKLSSIDFAQITPRDVENASW